MGGRWHIVACCLAWLLGHAPMAAADGDRPDRLHFEHVGDQDGAGPPFDIAAGRSGQSSYTLVLVSPPAYAALRALVSRAPPAAGRAAGTFEVTEYAGGQLRRRAILSPAAMKAAVALIHRDCDRQQARLPAAIAIQEQLLK